VFSSTTAPEYRSSICSRVALKRDLDHPAGKRVAVAKVEIFLLLTAAGAELLGSCRRALGKDHGCGTADNSDGNDEREDAE
jgi:hypothetical protein